MWADLRGLITLITLSLALWLTTHSAVCAHDFVGMGTGVFVTDTEVSASLQIAAVDCVILAPKYDTNSDGRFSNAEFVTARDALMNAVIGGFSVSSDGKPMIPSMVKVEVESNEGFTDEPHALNFYLRYITADASPVGVVKINPNLFRNRSIISPSQRPILAVLRNTITVNDRGTIARLHSSGHTIYQGTAAGTSNTAIATMLAQVPAAIEPPDPPQPAQVSAAQLFARFGNAGIMHILTGWDHLLFIIALVASASRLADLLKVMTAFTVAHAVTVCLAGSGIISMQSLQHFNVYIAATIVYVALENLLRIDKQINWRWALVFLFGLLHGLAFASGLKSLIASSVELHSAPQLITGLFAFNLGIELAQVLIILFIWPAFQWIRRTNFALARRVTIATSAAILLTEIAFVVARTLPSGIIL